MKTNYTKRKLKPGVTLIELTVVIVVILALISVLFIGAQAYRNGASRSACVVLLRQVHVATRSHQNLNAGTAGQMVQPGSNNAMDIATALLTVGATPGGIPSYEGFLTSVPMCPRDNVQYNNWTSANYPATGIVDIDCVNFGPGDMTPDGHVFFE